MRIVGLAGRGLSDFLSLEEEAQFEEAMAAQEELVGGYLDNPFSKASRHPGTEQDPKR
jgi:hypothetical protein